MMIDGHEGRFPDFHHGVIMDEQMKHINAAFQNWFGRSPDATIGRSLVEVFGEPVFNAVKDHVTRVLGGDDFRFEGEALYRLGGTKTISLHYQPLRSPTGEVEGFVAIVNDITERLANQKRIELIVTGQGIRISIALLEGQGRDKLRESQQPYLNLVWERFTEFTVRPLHGIGRRKRLPYYKIKVAPEGEEFFVQ